MDFIHKNTVFILLIQFGLHFGFNAQADDVKRQWIDKSVSDYARSNDADTYDLQLLQGKEFDGSSIESAYKFNLKGSEYFIKVTKSDDNCEFSKFDILKQMDRNASISGVNVVLNELGTEIIFPLNQAELINPDTSEELLIFPFKHGVTLLKLASNYFEDSNKLNLSILLDAYFKLGASMSYLHWYSGGENINNQYLVTIPLPDRNSRNEIYDSLTKRLYIVDTDSCSTPYQTTDTLEEDIASLINATTSNLAGLTDNKEKLERFLKHIFNSFEMGYRSTDFGNTMKSVVREAINDGVVEAGYSFYTPSSAENESVASRLSR